MKVFFIILGCLALAAALKSLDVLVSRGLSRTDLKDREAVRDILARYKDRDD